MIRQIQSLFALILLQFASCQPAIATDFVSYADGIEQAEEEHKPLVVLITASWCAPCQVMKRGTIIPMLKAELKNCVVSLIDIDEEPETASRLMKGREVPQIVMFNRRETGNRDWRKCHLIGSQSRARIAEALRKIRE